MRQMTYTEVCNDADDFVSEHGTKEAMRLLGGPHGEPFMSAEKRAQLDAFSVEINAMLAGFPMAGRG